MALKHWVATALLAVTVSTTVAAPRAEANPFGWLVHAAESTVGRDVLGAVMIVGGTALVVAGMALLIPTGGLSVLGMVAGLFIDDGGWHLIDSTHPFAGSGPYGPGFAPVPGTTPGNPMPSAPPPGGSNAPRNAAAARAQTPGLGGSGGIGQAR